MNIHDRVLVSLANGTGYVADEVMKAIGAYAIKTHATERLGGGIVWATEKADVCIGVRSTVSEAYRRAERPRLEYGSLIGIAYADGDIKVLTPSDGRLFTLRARVYIATCADAPLGYFLIHRDGPEAITEAIRRKVLDVYAEIPGAEHESDTVLQKVADLAVETWSESDPVYTDIREDLLN